MKNLVQKDNTPPDIFETLRNVYPGAKDDSINMVLAYCNAAKLDPIQKPVHIVPMGVRNAQTGRSEFRDVVMPGVGLYRIQAVRSGQYAGISEPEYGEDIETALGGVKITYPKWCRITVRKLIKGRLIEFTAKEYWLENYATRKDSNGSSQAPNAMWLKRPYGQLAKCAEAQALRKAFPEFVYQGPTAEEMEGKVYNEFDMLPARSVQVKSLNERLDVVLSPKKEESEEVARVEEVTSADEDSDHL